MCVFRLDVRPGAHVHRRDCAQSLPRGPGDLAPAGDCRRHPHQPGKAHSDARTRRPLGVNASPATRQVVGLDFILGNDAMWPLLLALSGAPAILQSMLLPLCPESPRYLYILLGKEREAEESTQRTRSECLRALYFASAERSVSVAGLYRLKGAYDASADLDEMRREKEEADKVPRVSITSLVGLPRWNFYTGTFPA